MFVGEALASEESRLAGAHTMFCDRRPSRPEQSELSDRV